MRQGARPHPHGQGVGPLALILLSVFFIFSKNNLHGFSGHFENFYFCTKNNSMAVLLKTASVRVSSIQNMQVESKTRGKVFGKVDTTETYQLPGELITEGFYINLVASPMMCE